MLDFQECTIETLQRYKPYFEHLPTSCTDLSVGTIWMWHEEQQPRICVQNDTLVLEQEYNGYPAYTWPIGPDADGMLDELSRRVRENDTALRFFAMNEEQLQQLLRDPRFPGTLWGYERQWSDYIYTFESFDTLRGGAMRKLRQRVNHFRNVYGEPDLRRLKKEHIPEARALLDAYDLEHPEKCKVEAKEFKNSYQLLEAFPALDLPALGLWVDGHMAAFTIGEVIGENLIIHEEKALLRYENAYPAIMIGFIHYMKEHWPGLLSFVNREDDSGDPGLRTIKERYHPIRMEHKYFAHVRSPGAKVKTWPVLGDGRSVLTPLRETDKEAYCRLCTDPEINRVWGYDFQEDFTVPDHPTPDFFYSSVQYDMSVGDSINYAIRLTEDGPMLGEVVLWNFTDAGSAELGVRLFPENIGKGLSKAAIPLLDYVENILGMTTRARCLNVPGNDRPRRGLAGSGFHEVGRDETYVYFERPRKNAAQAEEKR